MEQQGKFEGWAVVEVMGHQSHIGFVTTENYGAASLFRVDTPELPEREFTLTRPEWSNGEGQLPAGTKVKRAASPAHSVLVGAASIYRITPCSEEMARQQIERTAPRPLIVVERPAKAIEAPATDDDDVEDREVCDDCGCFEADKPVDGCQCECHEAEE